jgi:glucose/arabinose dehydrogenase
MSTSIFVCISASLILTLFSSSALAIAPYLESWRTLYPSSKSSDIGCQLCHLQRSGGEPWNAYGNDLRFLFNELDPSTRNIADAIQMIEDLNSDSDSPVTSNLDEINANAQPAWREGQVNPAYDRNYQSIALFFPPLTIDPFPEKITSVNPPFELSEIANGFTAPVASASAPAPSLRNQLFIADQIGIIWRVDLESGIKSVYLNLQARLLELGAFEACGYDERGLLGLAFHPQFAANGRIYVYTSQTVSSAADFSTLNDAEIADHQSVVSEIVIANPLELSTAVQISSERELLRFDQPQFNHNGGALAFDSQGLLYIGLGDGGGADDQGIGHGSIGNGNDPSNPFGAILRIDPMGTNSANRKYGIPIDNPFVNDSSRLSEIFAYGFRNPWKLSFDRVGRLLVADVGQNDIEEVNIVEAGKHYGWRIKEGRFFFDPNDQRSGLITLDIPDNLPPVDLINPVLEYDHDEGISITGGYVYRGARNASLVGKYIFGDFTKRLFIGDLNSREIKAINLELEMFVYSLAEDNAGELYILGSESINTCGSSTTGKLVKLKSILPIDDSFCVPIKAINGKFSIICL